MSFANELAELGFVEIGTNLERTFAFFNSLDPVKKYQICFSGGKDSHALAATYFAWQEATGRSLDIRIIFSDTRLESPDLYALVALLEEWSAARSVELVTVSAPLEWSFWSVLYGKGYPVPDRNNRWCTGRLKVIPMDRQCECVSLTGSHMGESSARDQRLTCNSGECGTDLIAKNKKKQALHPIAHWRSCHVWDFLLWASGRFMPTASFDLLHKLYKVNTDENSGSLRMGCFMCPVVAESTIAAQAALDIIPTESIAIRSEIEWLRTQARRLISPTSRKGQHPLGAILVDDRIDSWGRMQCFIPFLLENQWTSRTEIDHVNQCLVSRNYPDKYTTEWVAQHEPKAQTLDDWRMSQLPLMRLLTV